MTLGRLLTILGLAAAIGIGAACLVFGLRGSPPSLPGPVSSAGRAPSSTASTPTTSVPASTSPPVSIQIPAIGVSTPLGPALGLTAFGTLEVPDNSLQPAWYEDGPKPTEEGSSIIVGHVDSHTTEGIFFNLRELVPGDQIIVTQADGKTVTFEVTYVAQYPKTGFPDALVYGDHGFPGLNLITCGGVFDSATGHYESNVVIFSKEVR